MSVVIARGRSRSRSTGKGKRRALQSASRSASRSISQRGADAQDGRTQRGWSYPQGVTSFFDPFPRTMRAILRYSCTFSLDADLGLSKSKLFRCNSIYDPDVDLGGHQPYGHDTYQGIFDHYRVIKSVIKVTSTSTGGNTIFGLTITDDQSVSGSYDTIREVKPTKVLPLCNSPDSHSLAINYNANEWFGKGSNQASQTTLFGFDPADEAYFQVWVQGNLSTATTPAVAFMANICYYVEFTEIKDLGQS